jgi:hypothetical protein
MKCNGNSAETCGGPNRLDVYSYGSGGSPTTTISTSTTTISTSSTTISTSSTTTSTSSTTTSTSSTTISTSSPSATGGNPLPGWAFLGCYTDNVSGRALPKMKSVSGGMTNEGCQNACLAAGFSIAGTENAGECCKYQ